MPTRRTPLSKGRIKVSTIGQGAPKPKSTAVAPRGTKKPAIGKGIAGPKVLSDGTRKPSPPSAGPKPVLRRTSERLRYLEGVRDKILGNPDATPEARGRIEDLISEESGKVNASKESYFERLGQMESERQLRKQQEKEYKERMKSLQLEKLAQR